MNEATVSFSCVACGKKFTAPARFAGQAAKCTKCGASLTVPAPRKAVADPFAGWVRFGCRLCGTRLSAPPGHVGRKAKCPDCDTLTVIPPPPPAPITTLRPGVLDSEPYEVYEGDQPFGVDLARAAPASVSFSCRLCQTHLSASADRAGELEECPDCGAETRVPLPAKPTAKKPVADVADYALHEQAESRQVSLFADYAANPPAGFRQLVKADPQEKHAREVLDLQSAPTAGWGVGLFQGLMNAFVSTGILGAWLGLSLGLLVVGPIVVLVFVLLSNGGGMFGMIGGVMMMGLAVALSILWVSVASAILWSVLDDAAAGARSVRSWPTFDPTEWGSAMLTLVLAFVVASIPGALASRLVAPDPSWPWPLGAFGGWVVIGVALTLPLVLLSQLDNGAPWEVYSPRIARTLWRTPVTWFVFYATTIGLAIGSTRLFELLVTRMGFWSAPFLCLIEVLLDLLYFWLLGRVAWIAGAATPDTSD